MVIVINRILRVLEYTGDPGYDVQGETLPSYTSKSGSHTIYQNATSGNLSRAFPILCMITREVLAFLTPEELDLVRIRIEGVVDNDYYTSQTVCGYFGCGTQYILKSEIYPLPDLCEGVSCAPVCVGNDLYNNVCEDGTCVRGTLIEANSTDCGYVPPDPCEGVVCNPECVGLDMYNNVCEEGTCIQSELINVNDPECGYIPPEPEYPEIIDLIMENKEMVIVGTIVGILVLKSI